MGDRAERRGPDVLVCVMPGSDSEADRPPGASAEDQGGLARSGRGRKPSASSTTMGGSPGGVVRRFSADGREPS
jgi:hypothetical protein